MDIYYIGGSPCCGKSTVAELLTKKHDLRYYKLDDYLDDYMQKLIEGGNALVARTLGYSMEEMWMRPPQLLCREEMEIYHDTLPLVRAALAQYPADTAVLAEGAGLLPKELYQQGVPSQRYVCITPTREFQSEKYAQRPWIGQYLTGCSDPDRAFANWMERDALFGEALRAAAQQCGYHTILVDGSKSAAEICRRVEEIFGL